MPQVVIATKHRKARHIQPVLKELGFEIREYVEFDTDLLGTFSGEVERTLSPAECARLKAQKACELTGSRYGLGSEGSFGGGPYPGLMNWNEELLCLFDASIGQYVIAHAEGPFDVPSLEDFPANICTSVSRYPGQHWLLELDSKLHKGLTEEDLTLRLQRLDQDTRVSVQPDLRAMHSPARQAMIELAAQDLVTRLSSRCPACEAPDFVVKSVHRGLPCRVCGTPTSQIAKRVLRCDMCGNEESVEAPERSGDPASCPVCNP